MHLFYAKPDKISYRNAPQTGGSIPPSYTNCHNIPYFLRRAIWKFCGLSWMQFVFCKTPARECATVQSHPPSPRLRRTSRASIAARIKIHRENCKIKKTFRLSLTTTPRQADCGNNRRFQIKFLASCYSPILKCTVPSPLELLTTVFGKGTCVASPL